jgi:hypothetical protein
MRGTLTMSISDDDAGMTERPRGRRRRWVVGIVALVAVLGPAAYFVTAQLEDHRSTSTDDRGVAAPITATPSASPSAASPSAALSSAALSSAGSSAPEPKGASVDSKIRAAREAAAKGGHPLQRALTPHVAAAGEGPVSERTETTAEGTIRVVSAKFDLTGQQEMLIAADRGRPVGDARCTHRLHFSNADEPREIPNVLLCFRTSATRSVVTLAIGKKVSPSAATSTAVLAREWAKLG